MQEFSEFETVREEFLRMTGNKNFKVLAIDIVKNLKLEEKFEIQKSVFKAELLFILPAHLWLCSTGLFQHFRCSLTFLGTVQATIVSGISTYCVSSLVYY